jgi:hypothetical protein
MASNFSRSAADPIDRIKRLVVIAMFSDDALMEHLVLKGGIALDLVHRTIARASIDVDLSMGGDFPGGADALRARVEGALATTFRDHGLVVFDLQFREKPQPLSADLAGFWGGYDIEFKLLDEATHARLPADVDARRREAIKLGNRQKFEIDISKHEFIGDKQPADLDGYRIFVYSPRLVVCEKLRAICQQLPAYGPIVRRSRPSASRARDFVDIRGLMQQLDIDLFSAESRTMLEAVFAAKRVPLPFLRQIANEREFHRASFPVVQAAVRPGVVLESFDAYFDFVLQLVDKLEPLGDV